MRNILNSLCLVAILLFSSCIKEDLSNCPLSVNLTFSYYGDTNDPTMFAKMIDNVNLYVYDKSGILVQTVYVNKSDLNKSQGLKLNLAPGQYSIICWANVGEKTDFENAEDLSTAAVHHPNFGTSSAIDSNDRLYWGECDITVQKNQEVSGDILFKSAHIHFEIYITGVGVKNPLLNPKLAMSGLVPEYTMLMDRNHAYRVTYFPDFEFNPSLNMNVSRFHVLRFTEEEAKDINIDIYNNMDELVITINVGQFISDPSHIIKIDGINEVDIRILIEFSDVDVKITVPDWSGDVVIPEM